MLLTSIKNNIDWNLIATASALVIAIISPVITTICTNLHQRSLKKIELQHLKEMEYYQHRCNAFNNFFKELTSQIHNIGGNIFDYERSYHEVFIYMPEEYWDKLVSLNDAVLSKNKTKTDTLYLEVTKIMASLLQESIPV